MIWSHTAQAPVGDLFSLQDDLPRRLVESLSLPLTARERKMLKQDVPSSAAAYELYLRANETEPRLDAVARRAGAVRALHHRGPALRAGMGRRRPDAPAAREVHRGRIGPSTSNAPKHALNRALELNPDLSVAENVLAHLAVDLGRAEEAMVRLLRRAKDRPPTPSSMRAWHTPAATAG